MIAASERPRKLPVQEERHAGFDRARTDIVMRDQPRDRCLDERCLCRCEEIISGARGAGRGIRRALDPGNSAPVGLGRRAEFAIVNVCRGSRSGNSGDPTADQEPPAIQGGF